jgi:fumarate hydratase class II
MGVMYRIERDSLGEVKVPAGAYWGAQTERAIANFPVSGIRFSPEFIRTLALVKYACTRVNRDLRLLDRRIADAILRASKEIMDGRLADQFPLDIFQTGSGTSTNMNANEVIAARANEILTGTIQIGTPVHPNDHVNLGQSSNDVIPTVIHVAAMVETRTRLLPTLGVLLTSLREKERASAGIVKTGRTHLMDATPLTLGQEISGWGAQVQLSIERITSGLPRLSHLALGGTAIGTGINTPKGFGKRAAKEISSITKITFRETPHHFAAQSSQDAVAELSGHLRTYAMSLMKIANDLRWMNSGPMAGLAEIRLPALQPGSSIMPGKVNPVIPEAARMVAAQVLGNDAVVAVANAMGEFQLNVMLPVIAHNVLQSIALLANVSTLLATSTIRGFEVDEAHIRDLLLRNPIIATALNPIIGYEKGAEVVKKALKERKPVKDVVVELGYLSRAEAERVLDPIAMTQDRGTRRKT